MSSSNASASIKVAAPPDIVFDIVADARQHLRIDGSGTVKGHLEAPDRLSLGATFAMGMKLGAPYRIKNKVVEFEEDRRIAWRHLGLHRWRYELSPTQVGGRPGTRVTETWDVSHYPFFAQPVMRLLRARMHIERNIEATLDRLKAVAEEQAIA